MIDDGPLLDVLRHAHPTFGGVADTLAELADDPTVTVDVYERVCSAVFTVLTAWAHDAGAARDPRFGEPVGDNEVAGLAVAFKALVVRAGGRVEITAAELDAAAGLLARVDADPRVMAVELADGVPPDVPRFAADEAPAARDPRDADEPLVGLGDFDAGEGS